MHNCGLHIVSGCVGKQFLAKRDEFRYLAIIEVSLKRSRSSMFNQFYFRNLRTSSDSSKRFLKYCLYAFGVPMMMTFLIVSIEYLPLEVFDNFRPNIGRYRCAIQSDSKEIYFFVIPLSIVNVLSLFFISLAAFSMFKRSTTESVTGYTRLNAEKDRCVSETLPVFWALSNLLS